MCFSIHAYYKLFCKREFKCLREEALGLAQALWVTQGLHVLQSTSEAITLKLPAVLPENNWI